MHDLVRRSALAVTAFSIAVSGCGSDSGESAEPNAPAPNGADHGAAGAPRGPSGVGGASATGGDVGAGGVMAAGASGSVSAGGSAGAGGVKGTGGAPDASDSGATGGSSGTGGAPMLDAGPIVVHPCSSLPASGTWERITPPGDVGDSQCVRVHPTESGTIFVDMHKGGNGAHYPNDGLYKSTDCGATWSSLISNGRGANQVNSGSWWSFVVDPIDPKVIYTVDGYGAGGVWKSTNSGVDWDQTIPDDPGKYIPSIFLNGLAMDPTDNQHLLASVHNTCTGPAAGGCLPETFDAGKTWHLIKGPEGGWAEGSGPMIINRKTLLYATGFGGLYVTTDGGTSWTKVSGGAYPSLFRAPGGTYYVTSNGGLLISKDIITWKPLGGQSPRIVSMAGDDQNLYVGDQWSGSYYTAPADGVTGLKALTATGMPNGAGAPYMAYDAGHKLLYSSNFGGGLWRMVTR